MAYFLAESPADVDRYLEGHANDRGVMAHDVETTGLNTRKDHIVGASFSLQPGSGIYVPFRHKVGSNVPHAPVFERVHNCIEQRGLLVTYFNAGFDRTFTIKDCGWAPRRFRDVPEAAYHADNYRRPRDLKTLAKEDVGFDMARFDSLFTPEERRARHLRIDTKPARRCTDYACADADGTLRLDEHYDFIWKRHPFVVKVDTRLVDIIAEMEHEGGLELNREYIEETVRRLRWRREALEATIYRIAGRKFNLENPKDVGDLLFGEMGIPHPLPPKRQKGKSGQWVANAEALEAIVEATPMAAMIIAARKCKTALTGPLKHLSNLVETGTAPRFTLNQYTATTFRLSAPGGKPSLDGKAGVNAQAIGKGKSMKLQGVDLSASGSTRQYVEDLEDSELLVDLSEEIDERDFLAVKARTDDEHAGLLLELPYVLPADREGEDGKPFTGLACIRDTCSGCVAGCEARGVDVARRLVDGIQVVPSVRQAFRAPEGYVLVSMDYDGQEIVIAANLSKEPTWINALLADDPLSRDIHAQTAMKTFDKTVEAWLALADAARKHLRATGKSLNFGTLFGASAQNLAWKMGVPLAKAELIWEDYRRGLPVLFQWIDSVHSHSRARGYTQTYFGRRRNLLPYYQSSDRGLQAYADRCAVNTWIQGTGADCTRIAMVKIDNALQRHQVDRAQARFGLQIHDELMYLVREREAGRVIPVLKEAMEFEVKGWQVQLKVGVKVGPIWGLQEKWAGA